MSGERLEGAGGALPESGTLPTPDNQARPLTDEEVELLPHGTEVIIMWSGGNGPHRGRVVFNDVMPFYVPEHEYDKGPDGPMWFYNPITFVGDQRYHTRVWTVVQESQP